MNPRGRTRRPPILRWVVIFIALGALAWFARPYYRKSKKIVYPPTAFYEVKRADMLISVIEEGALRALNETVIRSQLDGFNRIIRLAPEGSHVKKGDLLVEMDSAGLRDRLNEMELVYQDRLFISLQAQENLKIQKSLAESQIKDAELKLKNAEDDLEKYRDGDAPLQIRTLEARLGVMREQVRIASERYDRTQVLAKSDNATRSELEADALTLKREQLAVGQYEEDLRLIKKFDQPNQVRLLESKVVQAREDLGRLKQRTTNEIAQVEADLKTGRRALDFLDESLKLQKRRLENAKIMAPQDGLVVYAAVSQIQSGGGGNDVLRELNNRFGRSGAGGRGGGGFGDSSGEFRGGGNRRGRGGSSGSGGSTSGSFESGGGIASVSANVSAANQRIASAITGASAAESTGSGGGGGASGASRTGGGSTGGSGSSGGGSSGGAGFASYASMRPSSTLGNTSASSTGGGSSSGGSSSSSSMSSGSSQVSYSGGNQSSQSGQYGNRSGGGGGGQFGFSESSGSGMLEEGSMVRMRQELIRLPDVSKMLAEIRIHESRVGQVTLGMTAYIKVETIPGKQFKGTVRKIAPLPDAQMAWLNPETKVYPADILIDEQLPMLKPGVSARAEIVITNLTKVLSVPIQTVTSYEGDHVCWVKRGDGVVPVSVTTGWFNDRFVEVKSGLKEGDLVLLAATGDDSVDMPGAETNKVENVEQPASQPAEQPAARPQRSEQSNGEGAVEGRRGGGERGERGGFNQGEGRQGRGNGEGQGGRRRQRNSEEPE